MHSEDFIVQVINQRPQKTRHIGSYTHYTDSIPHWHITTFTVHTYVCTNRCRYSEGKMATINSTSSNTFPTNICSDYQMMKPLHLHNLDETECTSQDVTTMYLHLWSTKDCTECLRKCSMHTLYQGTMYVSFTTNNNSLTDNRKLLCVGMSRN